MLALVAGSCGYHLGPAPLALSAVSLGQVRAYAGDAGPEEELRAALADGLARRGVESGGPTLDATVLSAEDRALSVGAALQQIELQVSFELWSSPPQQLSLIDREPYALAPEDPLGTEQNRRAALRVVAGRLADDALSSLLGGGRP